MVGHSFGGAVAVNAAVGSVDGLAPVAVDRLVTIASPSSMPKLFADFGRMLKLGPRSQSVVEAQVQRLTGRGIGEFDSARQLLRVPLPTLVIHDAEDREVAVEEAQNTARAGDHVRLHVTQGLGHRRIITDPNVIREAVDFVVAAAQPVMVIVILGLSRGSRSERPLSDPRTSPRMTHARLRGLAHNATSSRSAVAPFSRR